MLWLAVESATIVASVAVGRDDLILAEVTSHAALTHSERLLPMIDQALVMAGVALPAVDTLIASAGPGSFTGLRIGLATVKGLAHARGLPVYLVSTLEGLAWQQQHVGVIVPLLDARKQQVYTAVYSRNDGGLQTLLPPTALALSELLQYLDRQSVLFVGEGSYLHQQQIAASAVSATFAGPLHNWPRASSLAAVARQDGRLPVDIQLLHPDYLRASSAEQKLLGPKSREAD